MATAKNTTTAAWRTTLVMVQGGSDVELGDVTSVQWSGFTVSEVDVTFAKSLHTEPIPGRKDLGSVTVTLNYTPGGDGETAIEAAAEQTRTFRIYVDATAETPEAIYEFDGFITAWTPAATGEGTVYNGSLTIRRSSENQAE